MSVSAVSHKPATNPAGSRTRRRTTSLAILLPTFLLTALPLAAQEGQPLGLGLTWIQDPTTTMTIDWHVGDPSELPGLDYRVADGLAWSAVSPDESFPFPFTDRHIHRVELTGLEPGTRYEFRFADGGEVYAFETFPADIVRTPLRLAIGGDIRHTGDQMTKTGRVAAQYNPHAFVFGGDLAYANGDPRRVDRWIEWFEITRDEFRAPDGRIIPLIVGIGNHEVWYDRRLGDDDPALLAEWGLQDGDAPFFNTLFPQPSGKTYRVLDVGDYLSLVILDTDHVEPVAGEQTEWLARVLAERTHIPHVIPIYHVPAYPSVRAFDGGTNIRVRQLWSPLFEEYRIPLAFEHHDHIYKRTVPIREGQEHPNGVVYLGDGSWGVSPREIGRSHAEPAWYLKRAAEVRHAQILTLHGPMKHVLMVDEDNRIIDEFPRVMLDFAGGPVARAEPARVILGEMPEPEPAPVFISVAPQILTSYVGQFEAVVDGAPVLLEVIQMVDGSLGLNVPILGAEGLPLRAETETLFHVEELGARLQFEAVSSGPAQFMEVHYAGDQATAVRVESDGR